MRETKTVRKIDSSLVYRRTLFPSRLLVFEVEKDGLPSVLKTNRNSLGWGFQHLNREAEALKRARYVEGITCLLQEYSSSGYCLAIRKEFAPGNSLFNLGSGIGITYLQIALQNTVRALHELGIADLDLSRKNIVLSPEEKDCSIVDLGTSRFSEELSFKDFNRLRYKDIHNLERGIFE
ncbi:MAG: hypothetical protein AABW50_05205 [Nanoarchaeota archaeon]